MRRPPLKRWRVRLPRRPPGSPPPERSAAAPLPGGAAQQPLAEGRPEQGQQPQTGETSVAPGAKDTSPRNRLASAMSDFAEAEAAPSFGRANRGQSDEKAVDLDAQDPRRALGKTG